jgi:dolichyl-phosphate-mannose--protein O-mannosyl transferase
LTNPWLAPQVYLMGNPLIFAACLIPPPLYIALGSVLLVRRRRGIRDLDPEAERRFWSISLMWLAFLLHYVPFFFMKRQV